MYAPCPNRSKKRVRPAPPTVICKKGPSSRRSGRLVSTFSTRFVPSSPAPGLEWSLGWVRSFAESGLEWSLGWVRSLHGTRQSSFCAAYRSAHINWCLAWFHHICLLMNYTFFCSHRKQTNIIVFLWDVGAILFWLYQSNATGFI